MAIDPAIVQKAVEQPPAALSFSGVVLVREGGHTVFEKAYGLANRAEPIPNTPDTRFAIASGCKIFTSVAVCRLVEQGLLAFDDCLTDCLDIDFPLFDKRITVHQLLTHSSGIPDYFDEEANDDYEALWKERPMYAMREPRDFLPMFGHQAMKFAPGERFLYNDAGFIVLGLIVEQHTKMPFIDYIQEHIFAPCSMMESGYFATDRLPERTACGYIEDESGTGWRTNFFAVPIVGGPDGGAYTTAKDMSKFWSALFGRRLLGDKLTRQLLHPHIAATSEGENICYGYGVWMTMKDDEVVSYYATGWDPGVAFISRVFPQSSLEITVLANTNKPAFEVYRAIIKAIEDN